MSKSRPDPILFVSPDASLTGAPLCLLDIMKGIDRGQFRPVFFSSRPGPLINEVERLEIEYHLGRGWNLPHLMRLIREKNIRLVHANTLFALEAVVAARICRLAAVWHIHENPHLMLNFRISHIFARILSSKIIAVSRGLKEVLDIPGKTVVVHTGIDLNMFQAFCGEKIRKEFSITGELIGQIASIEPQKGVSFFIHSASRVAKSYPQAKFIIVGSSPEHKASYVKEMKQLARVVGMEEKIIFAGTRNDIPEIINGLDILVLPSVRWESFSRTILEAMACAKPVIATDVGGNREAIIPGITGLLVPPKNVGALADAIIALLSNKEKARRMGEEGRRRMEDFFSLKRYIQEIEGIYRELLF